MAAGTGISVRGVHKAYRDRRVLAGVDLDVTAGTITAVLGPSGCGKTTLLRIVAGFDDPDAGVVRIAGHTVVGNGAVVPAHRRRVGLMPQEGALFPHLSVGGNVAFGLTSRNGVAADVSHWLEVVGLPGLADARPHELSGGQQQRVALARALAARPRVLLLDEPFAALDAGLRVRVREDIAEILRAAGTTAVLVTHDQSEALSLADSVALLFDGTVAQHAAPTDLYERPANLQTARFVGATVELPGTCHGGVARTALGAHPVRPPAPDGPVVVVLRPEQLRAGHAGAPGGERDAVVRACRFYGAYTVLHVVLRDGTALRLRSTGDARLEAGAIVSVEVDGPVLAYASPAGG
ncbi:ABC transporter ATP-binding protein [Mycolicibacterium goodii]|uniref:ABC transporter ATP-binding protein n=1 Tax=Mycolicibacterium goodii TaxID=134601 RepID=A0ABS6HTC4_MYCGD|nr:ABC transporter ATP-binding protein [Mycolicibacterium goodii]MBU8819815.1 ABC transporter ATP-binding protein [Mycolicibacterium goodii]MBU8825946.1 ABC transporter ATP-binding protein [Mycolicibacterium goodii]MBU8839319.1 ABC transporter ATP-binding protein [Mycolicibacterium goodii]PJK19458.1 ABC transporter ATP-binding protein [Mycolicibacterium goodii]